MSKNLYLLKTYMATPQYLYDGKMTAISENIEDIQIFCSSIRHIPIITESDIPNLPDDIRVVGMITEASFYSNEDKNQYINHEDSLPFLMVHYGAIDRKFTGLKKADSKDLMLPQILCNIIEKQVEAFRGQLKVTNHTLKELFYYLNGLDNANHYFNETNCIFQSTKFLNKIEENGDDGLVKDMYRRHPMLFCNETIYRYHIDRELEEARLQTRYNMVMDEE